MFVVLVLGAVAAGVIGEISFDMSELREMCKGAICGDLLKDGVGYINLPTLAPGAKHTYENV